MINIQLYSLPQWPWLLGRKRTLELERPQRVTADWIARKKFFKSHQDSHLVVGEKSTPPVHYPINIESKHDLYCSIWSNEVFFSGFFPASNIQWRDLTSIALYTNKARFVSTILHSQRCCRRKLWKTLIEGKTSSK